MAEAAPPAPNGFPVAFHFNVGERLPYACRLARKAVARGDRLLMVGPREILDALDPLLWTFSALDFIAHLRVDTGAALPGDWCEATPVLLHDESAMGAVRAEDVSGRWLVNLGDAVPEDYARFGGVVEIVGDAPAERAAARLRWRRYAADGHDIQQHDLKALREGRT